MHDSRKILGVVLARAGSAGLKDKHLRPLMGRPVIEYTFDHARASARLTHIIVSSDCPSILTLAKTRGFDTIARPPHLASAEASVQDALLHALRTVEAQSSFRADVIVTLYGNVPVRPAGVIDRAIELLMRARCDSVRTFCPVGKWHPAWMASIDGDRVAPLQPGSVHRRQDLAPVFLHDGAVVAVTRNSLLCAESNSNDPHAFFGPDRRALLTEIGETIEIDHFRELLLAEAVLRERVLKKNTTDVMRIAS